MRIIAVVMSISIFLALSACGGRSSSDAPIAPTSSESPSTPGDSDSLGSGQTSTSAQTPPTDPDAHKYGGVLRIIGGDTQMQIGLPVECLQISDQTTLTPTGEGLVRETAGGDIVPWLCESFEPDEENSEIRFKLKEGVTFLDGSSLTGKVVEWNFKIAKEHGDLDPSILYAEARGDYEVALVLDGYSNVVLNMLASQAYDLASMVNYEKNGIEQARAYPVTTGPFKLKERVPGYHIVYERNNNYWIEGRPYLDGVEFVQITDVMTQNATMISTGIDAGDVLNTTLAEQISTLRDSGAPLTTEARLASGPTNLFPSSRNEDSPFAKYEVRQATAYAIDRQLICDARGFGILTPATQVIAEGYKGHIPNADYCTYDPEKARELLSQAGYPNGFSTKLYAGSALDRDIVVIIQKMLEDVGITSEIQILEPAAGVEMRHSTGWEGLSISGVLNIANTYSSFRMSLDPDYAFNISTWRPAEEMRPVYIHSRETLMLQDDLMQQVHRYIMDSMVVIPMYNSFRTFILRDNIQDSEFALWGTGTWWLPHQTWKS